MNKTEAEKSVMHDRIEPDTNLPSGRPDNNDLNYIFVYWDLANEPEEFFRKEVSDRINDGYIPIGGLVRGEMIYRSDTIIYQAMYKPLERIISKEELPEPVPCSERPFHKNARCSLS